MAQRVKHVCRISFGSGFDILGRLTREGRTPTVLVDVLAGRHEQSDQSKRQRTVKEPSDTYPCCLSPWLCSRNVYGDHGKHLLSRVSAHCIAKSFEVQYKNKHYAKARGDTLYGK